MREILFRGKTKVYNKWVYGWYCGKILNHDMHSTEESSQIIDDKTLYWHTCEPDTVGQFTGLTDKNGKKIFDGDVVLYPWNDQDNPEIFTIKFKDGQFIASPVKETEDYWDFMVGGYSKEMEIIGNIHDNPELLENP